MYTYKSKTGRTLAVNRYQITPETGVELAERDEALDELVTSGFLEVTSDQVAAVVEAPKATAPVKTGV